MRLAFSPPGCIYAATETHKSNSVGDIHIDHLKLCTIICKKKQLTIKMQLK